MKNIYVLLHISVLLAGFTGIFGKLISLNEGLLVWYRVILSALLLFIIVKSFRVNLSIDNKSKLSIAKGGILLTMHWLFFYASIKYSNISIGVICYCLTSFFTAIIKPFFKRTKLNLSELLLSSLTLIGICLIFHFETSFQLGIVLGVVSSVLGTFYTLNNERLSKHFDSIFITYYQMIGGTVALSLLLPIYLHYFPVAHIMPNLKDAIYLILLSSFCTVGMYIAQTKVLKSVPAFTVNLTYNLEPVYSIILAFILFGEGKQVSFSFYIGLSLIILSVALQTLINLSKRNILKID